MVSPTFTPSQSPSPARPLSRAVNAALFTSGFPNEFAALASDHPPYVVGVLPVSSAFTIQRRAAKPLIDVSSLQEKREHFLAAMALKLHPLDSPPLLSAGVASALRRIKLEGRANLPTWRTAAKENWLLRVRRCRCRQQELAKGLPPHLGKVADRVQSIAFGQRLRDPNPIKRFPSTPLI